MSRSQQGVLKIRPSQTARQRNIKRSLDIRRIVYGGFGIVDTIPPRPPVALPDPIADAMDEKLWCLKHCRLLDRLDDQQLRRLESDARIRTFERKTLVYMPADQNESVMLIATGRVRLYHITPDGKESVLALVDPGELFGENAFLEAGKREEFAETMERSTVISFPRQQLQRLAEETPYVSMEVVKLMGYRRGIVERRLRSLLFRTNRERLILLLLELLQKYGQETSDGVILSIKLSHQEFANMIGSTRETVTVLLGDLQAEGRLVIKRRQIILKDISTLAESIDEPEPRLPTQTSLFKCPNP